MLICVVLRCALERAVLVEGEGLTRDDVGLNLLLGGSGPGRGDRAGLSGGTPRGQRLSPTQVAHPAPAADH